MAEKSVFEQIKKQNGETFAKVIRAYDNGIFDVSGLVEIVKYAGREAEPIIPYLESLKRIEIETGGIYKDPIELLDEAGYDAWYADTLEKQNAISKYFAPEEELCTFNDDSRFKRFYIINAVRRDADQLKRSDFYGQERREDAYATSVLSIQILKTGGFISIKNRYNHTVANPDNTFHSNPDKIIKGLSDSLYRYFRVNFSSQRADLPDPFIVAAGKLIRYNFEAEGIYFGDGFYVEDKTIEHINKDKEILMGPFLLDLKYGTVQNIGYCSDCFPSVFMKEIRQKIIQVTKDETGHHIFIRHLGDKNRKTKIATIRNGRLVALNLPTTKYIPNDFLANGNDLEEFRAPHLEGIEDNFMFGNKCLRVFKAPVLKSVGEYFLPNNQGIKALYLPTLQEAGKCFLTGNENLRILHAPMLRTVGHTFCRKCRIRRLNLPALRISGSGFMEGNEVLSDVKCPSLSYVGDGFLTDNRRLRKLFLPQLRDVGTFFMRNNRSLEELDLPSLEQVGESFLEKNERLHRANLPALQFIDNYFLHCNRGLDTLNLPSLKNKAAHCLVNNPAVEKNIYNPKRQSVAEKIKKIVSRGYVCGIFLKRNLTNRGR